MPSIFKNEEKTGARVLQTPRVRLPLRDDFPGLFYWTLEDPMQYPLYSQNPAAVIEKQLKKLGATLQDQPRITIAYPHKKNSFFSGKVHRMTPIAHQFLNDMREKVPQADWILADGLCEEKKLRRVNPKHQNTPATLKNKQNYNFYADQQSQSLPFIDSKNAEKELFVLFDDVYCQGTTAVNMINFIEHNGGYVLNAFASVHPFGSFDDQETRFLSQNQSYYGGKRSKELSSMHAFKNAAFNRGRIPEIAEAFYQASRKSQHKNLGREQCLEKIEEALNRWGHSLTTLTNGECEHIPSYLNGYSTWTKHVDGLGYDGFLEAFAGGPFTQKTYKENFSPR